MEDGVGRPQGHSRESASCVIMCSASTENLFVSIDYYFIYNDIY